ncbi:hypothetical protein D3C71_1134550 [compost metagenome]
MYANCDGALAQPASSTAEASRLRLKVMARVEGRGCVVVLGMDNSWVARSEGGEEVAMVRGPAGATPGRYIALQAPEIWVFLASSAYP